MVWWVKSDVALSLVGEGSCFAIDFVGLCLFSGLV